MRRIAIEPRPNWRAAVEHDGLLFHTTGETPYWCEDAYYEFTEAQVDSLIEATEELHGMCLNAVEHVIQHGLCAKLGIPEVGAALIEASWRRQDPYLYGRFDLAYDGVNPPKLLEYNADTPTALLEAAVIQWKWLEQVFPDADQFNSIWEALVERFQKLSADSVMGGILHFASVESLEDEMTVTMLMDAAQEAKVTTNFLEMKDIGWHSGLKIFVDLQDRPIHTIFKLYPWEAMLHDAFSQNLAVAQQEMKWLEPIWKLVLSSKGILAVLWDIFPDHPLLLEAYIGNSGPMTSYVQKPLFGREGANIRIVGEAREETGGEYGAEGFVYQRYHALPDFEGRHALVGSWMVGDHARGMGIRESDGLITTNLSRFVPHIFVE